MIPVRNSSVLLLRIHPRGFACRGTQAAGTVGDLPADALAGVPHGAAYTVDGAPRDEALEPRDLAACLLVREAEPGEDEGEDPVPLYQELGTAPPLLGEGDAVVGLVDEEAAPRASSSMVFVTVDGSTPNRDAIRFVFTLPPVSKMYLRYSTFLGESSRPSCVSMADHSRAREKNVGMAPNFMPGPLSLAGRICLSKILPNGRGLLL